MNNVAFTSFKINFRNLNRCINHLLPSLFVFIFNDSYHKKKAANTWRIIFNYLTSNPLMVKNWAVFFLFLRILVWRIFSCFDQTINSVHYRILFPRSRKKKISSRSFLHAAFLLKLDEILLSNTIVRGCFCHVVQKKKHRIFNFWLKLLISFVTVHQDSQSKASCIFCSLFVR